MSHHERPRDQRFVRSTRDGATLSSLVAAQRQEELARLVESRSRSALALAAGRELEGLESGHMSTAGLVAWVRLAARRAVAAIQPRLTHALEAHSSRTDARARTAPSGPDSQFVCCA